MITDEQWIQGIIVIMGVSALIGKQLLEAMGINLSALQVVGGLIIAGMGFEMLYGGSPSKAQGQSEREREEEEGTSDGEGLLLPLSTPLLAGPVRSRPSSPSPRSTTAARRPPSRWPESPSPPS